uniref:ADP-ribosylation factor n=1 Tax=Cyanoderma ruficeps TaxID=181631 RepID=A0A8C3QN83_9PASS
VGLLQSSQLPLLPPNILMLGLDSAGKSTLLYKLRYKDAFLTMPTIGFNVDMIDAGKDFTLTFWDVGGQKKMRELWSNFLEELLYINIYKGL